MELSHSSPRSLACVFSKTSFASNRETLDYLLGVSVFYERSAVFLFRSSFFVFMKNCGVNPELAGERDFIKAASLLGVSADARSSISGGLCYEKRSVDYRTDKGVYAVTEPKGQVCRDQDDRYGQNETDPLVSVQKC